MNKILYIFQGRTVDMKTLTLIEEPTEANLEEAEAEFERLLEESSQRGSLFNREVCPFSHCPFEGNFFHRKS